jgi:hypothetical protein
MSRLLPAVAIAALFAGSTAFAQTSTPGGGDATPSAPTVQTPAPSPSPSAPAEKMAPLPGPATTAMTEEDAKSWIDKAIYSSDDKNVGSVAAIERDASGVVTGMQADIGGFLGIGTTRVKLTPVQFQLSGDRVLVNLPSEQVKQLPKVTE